MVSTLVCGAMAIFAVVDNRPEVCEQIRWICVRYIFARTPRPRGSRDAMARDGGVKDGRGGGVRRRSAARRGARPRAQRIAMASESACIIEHIYVLSIQRLVSGKRGERHERFAMASSARPVREWMRGATCGGTCVHECQVEAVLRARRRVCERARLQRSSVVRATEAARRVLSGRRGHCCATSGPSPTLARVAWRRHRDVGARPKLGQGGLLDAQGLVLVGEFGQLRARRRRSPWLRSF